DAHGAGAVVGGHDLKVPVPFLASPGRGALGLAFTGEQQRGDRADLDGDLAAPQLVVPAVMAAWLAVAQALGQALAIVTAVGGGNEVVGVVEGSQRNPPFPLLGAASASLTSRSSTSRRLWCSSWPKYSTVCRATY